MDNADPTVYVDPHPGKKGSDLVWEKCWAGCDNGLYPGPSGLQFVGSTKASRYTDKWCFKCNGAGGRWVKVSSVRARVRREVKRAQQWRDETPVRTWLEAEFNWKSDVREWLKAEQSHRREQERRASLAQGFVAELGGKIRNLTGTITVSHSFESYNPYSFRDEWKNLLIITCDDGKVLKFVSTGDSAFGHHDHGQFQGWSVGDRVVITSAKVKMHDNYKGQDQTVLSNARIKPAS